MGEFYFGDVVRQGEWLAQVHVVPFLDVILKEDLDQPIRNRGAPDGDVFNPDLSLAIRGVELSIGGHSLLAFEERNSQEVVVKARLVQFEIPGGHFKEALRLVPLLFSFCNVGAKHIARKKQQGNVVGLCRDRRYLGCKGFR